MGNCLNSPTYHYNCQNINNKDLLQLSLVYLCCVFFAMGILVICFGISISHKE